MVERNKEDPHLLEREAHSLFSQGDAGQAYTLFKKSGEIYRSRNNHKESALCFASAASCWAVKSGERMFHNSSLAYEEAAKEAEAARDFEYASLLYRYAAINYERDMEFFNFSDCFFRSRECLRKFFTRSLIMPHKIHHIGGGGIKSGETYGIMKRIGMCFFLTFSALIWGHGEKPGRTFASALLLILLPVFFYMRLTLTNGDTIFHPNFLQALYLSIITFTTVGYGDITPVGLARVVAMIEVFCGIFIIPIFIVGLSRKYLRV